MSYVVDDLFEIATCEIKINNAKNIIVSCCYRTPGGSIAEFNDKISTFLENVNRKKSYFLCGDFNINTINYETHKHTKEFADIASRPISFSKPASGAGGESFA